MNFGKNASVSHPGSVRVFGIVNSGVTEGKSVLILVKAFISIDGKPRKKRIRKIGRNADCFMNSPFATRRC